jgi:rSAM/selenodomain-associated transferase 1
MRRGVAVLVFARAPLPGRAKTRLAPRLGEWGAARLQARLTLRALRTALGARCGRVELHGAPRADAQLFLYCKNFFRVELAGQRGADLGARMHRSLARALRRHRAAIVIGTDCPALRPRDLRRACRLLQGCCDAVIGPAEDGGYVLLGARRVSPALFEGIAWGGADVCAATRQRLARLGLRWRELPALWDLDRPEDLDRLARGPACYTLPHPKKT